MLTGRRAKLRTIRQRGGLSGFLKRTESQFDTFGAGHAGTSISAAVGIAEGLKAKGSKAKSIAIIGDGSMTSGMAFEALNHAGEKRLDNLIVILNDNEMSISPNVGAVSWLFSKTASSKLSTIARTKFKELHNRGYVPHFIYKAIDRAEEAALGFLHDAAMLFEAFGFRYIGPVDGHSFEPLITALQQAKDQDGPVLVHVCTQKGRGYALAEADPVKWHGVTPFQVHDGKSPATTKKIPSYTEAFAQTLLELAQDDERIRAITAAMPTGTGLDLIQRQLPLAFVDVGIAEQHGVTLAAGMATEGLRPIVAIYSTFLQRAFDQIVHDVCIQNLPVIFAIDRGGLVGNDGETHQGVFDIAYLRTIPNIVLMSPQHEGELRDMMYTALCYNGPIAIRYPRGSGVGADLSRPFERMVIGQAAVLRTGKDVLIIAYGPMVQTALKVAERLLREHGISTTVINARFAKPLDTELLGREIAKHSLCVTMEDHALAGGFGAGVLELINELGLALPSNLLRFGVPDDFIPHGSQAEQHQLAGLGDNQILGRIVDSFGEAVQVAV
jgi:1-deoxy-D-xylulose-5-phosphate synthase